LRILPLQSDMQEPAVDFPRGGFLFGAAQNTQFMQVDFATAL
jgi:hypothetical protein